MNKSQYIIASTATIILTIFGMNPIRALALSVAGSYAIRYGLCFVANSLVMPPIYNDRIRDLFLVLLFSVLTIAVCIT